MSKFENVTCNNNIRKIRLSKNLSLRDVEKDTGIDNSVLCAIELGKRRVNIRVAQILSDYFNVSVDYLLGRCSKPHSTKESEDLKSDLLKCVLLLEVDGKNTKKQVRDNLKEIIAKYFKEDDEIWKLK